MALHKTLVLDANILVRAVLSAKVRTVLEQSSSDTRFFAPDVCFDDAEKYLPLIFEKRGLPAESALEVLTGISRIVQTVEVRKRQRHEMARLQRKNGLSEVVAAASYAETRAKAVAAVLAAL